MICTSFHPQKHQNSNLKNAKSLVMSFGASRSPPGPRDFISSAQRRRYSKINGGEEQNEIVERI